jgi:RNA polymerase sigma-54 factor
MNDDILPPIRINRQYFKLLDSEGLPQDSKDYIRQKISAGKWLLKSLHQRKETLFRITTLLAKKQRDYIIDPEGKLSPMTMKSVAEELDIHESTVARAVTDKYLACPRGLIPLRSFFTNAYHTNNGNNLSSRTVKDILLEILNNENKKQPLSDEELSQKIKENGIECARRTVSKYRKELNIGTASQRKTY